MTDRSGPGLASAKAIIELEELLNRRGCSITIRWTPAHEGVEGNELAGSYTGAKLRCGRPEVSSGKFRLPTRKAIEARSLRTRGWVRDRVRGSR